MPRRAFSTEGFLRTMVHRRPAALTAPRLTPSALLAPETLDEHPDPATAWVTGFYALALRRRPDAPGLRMHSRALRHGASPEAVLDEILASPEAVAAGTSRPDLHEAFVTGCYLICLGRLPDPQGLTSYAAELASGVPEASVLDSLLASEEAHQQLRFPPARVDVRDLLAERIQSVAVHRQPTDELTTWAKDALRRGIAPHLIVRSLARRLHGVSRTGVQIAVTARARAASAKRAATADVLQEELLRDRAWQWRLHRSTWERLDRLERLLTEGGASPSRPGAPGTP